MRTSLLLRFSIILSWISSLHLLECQGSRLQGDADQINSVNASHWAREANDSNYGSFSWTMSNNNAWWRIQLDEGSKLVSKIEIHNRPRNAAGTHQYNDLAKIYILTSNTVLVKNNAAYDPSPTSQYWAIQSYQEEPYGPVGIIQLNPHVSATWVAVFSENNAQLALAQVEVYDSSLQSPSLNLTLASTDVGSVKLTWTLVTAQTVARYEYKCTGKDWIVYSGNEGLTVTVGGYTKETDVVCMVIAVVNSGESQQDSAAITTGNARPVNIARQGTANQIDSLDNNEAYYAPSGNNGIYDDFSHTDSNDGSWWRVDLHSEFFIGRIELFNRQGGDSEGPYYERLQNIAILTSITNPVPPCRNCLQWTEQSYQIEPYGPVGIILFDPQIYARYVAVYRSTPSSSLALTEVEIYISALLDGSITLTLSPCGSTCIDLEWTPLQGSNGNIVRYEYKCGSSNWVSVSSDVIFARACGVTPSTQVICTVMAVVGGDASQEVSQTIQTGNTGSCNIAYKKYTHQLDDYNPARTYPASLAVNGIIDVASDFTHTSGSNSGKKWWRLDLGISYHIGRIELYNRLGDLGEAAKYYYRLVKISVLTSDVYLPGPPSLNATAWKRRDGPNSKAYGPVRIIEFSTQISARHVAVYSESTEPLSLTEVTVYESNSLTKPLKSQLTNTSSDCMELSWTQPKLAAGESIARYEWNCTDKEWIIVTGSDSSFIRSSCNYQPYTNVTCSVAVMISNGTSELETISAYTSCANPDPPDVVAISDLVKEKSEELGRETWKYTITWNPPSRVNCHGTISYIYSNNTETTEETDDTSYTVHLDGGQLYNFTIWSRNSHGQSTPVVRDWRANDLVPQFKETDIKIVTNSSQCIQLTVKGPKYPGGHLATFQSKCSGESTWTDLDINEETARNVCTYSSYTAVICEVKANNSAGVTTEVRNISTLCADPELIGKIELSQHYISGSNTRTITVNMTQNITTNCEQDIITLEASIDDGEFTSELTFPNLAAHTEYTIKLKFTNSKNMSTEESIVERTGDLAPGTAPVLTGNATNSSCVHITWSEPILSNGDIKKYKYKCQNYTSPGNFTDDSTRWNETDPLQKSLTECGFNFGDTVYCGITSFTSVGHGPTLILSTQVLCTNPSTPEFDVQSYLDANQSVTIEILLQASEHYCRRLQEYKILIKESDSSKTIINSSSPTPGNLTYSGFKPYTTYSVEVVAVNDDGKTSTNGTLLLSAEKKPDTVPSITSLESTTSCVEIKTIKPSEPNGLIIKYQFNCTSLSTENSTTVDAAEDESGSVEMCGFSPVTNVTCSVAALNKAGISPLVVESKYTQIKVDSTAPGPKVLKPEAGQASVPVELTKPNLGNVKIKSFLLLLLPTENKVKRSAAVPCDEDFVRNATPCPSTTGSCCATAELTEQYVGNRIVFNVGDGDTYGKYENTKLKAESTYDLYLAVTVDVQEDEILVHVGNAISIQAPKAVMKAPVTSVSPPTSAVAGGVSGGVIAVVILIIIVVILLKRKRPAAKKKSPGSDNELTNIQLEESTNSSVSRVSNPGFEYENAEEIFPRNINRIPVRELRTFITNNVSLMKTQFEKLEALPKPKMEVALMPHNKGKCRYKLLYPADDRRVVLRREGEGNDFINASYIAGYNKDNAYIAAQGPTRATVNDFWYMVWQERPSAIVMVTRAVESGKNKCEQYWPLDKQPKTFGDVTVCSKSVECWADFTQTRLSISKDDQTRTLSHFNYLSWPDHGVPDDLSSYVAFYFKIKSLVSRSTSPLLIHCSAGVGRTGTYIALEYLIQQAKREEAVDVFGCVEAMRKRRPCMVQKDDQYIFLHEVLAESLAVEGFKCFPLEINDKIDAYKRGDTRNQSKSILQEFQHMESRLQNMQFKYTIAQEEDNLGKNRFPDILPCDKYMPFLTNGRGSYINAVFVDSYTSKHQFIATQLPLSNTLSNFWQLIIEQDVKVIVQLEHAEMPFFPMTDLATLSTSLHSLVRGTAEEKKHVRIIPLKIQTSQLEKSIFILQIKAWCDTAEQYPTGEALLSLCGAVDDILKKTDGSKKICVTCLDGSKRCGVFISSSNAIEKLKNEQEIDVYSPTMMAKTRRPQFVSTIDDYLFIYQVLKNYADSFAEYANFN